ncbi:MAG: hypothetical protein KF749_13305 [Bacteroidetes bacterium]|nr:hypothetical protein [Bacteroidota bacterium]MCW5894329.1 hypothetical protein [Bacteroidota bacterium]
MKVVLVSLLLGISCNALAQSSLKEVQQKLSSLKQLKVEFDDIEGNLKIQHDDDFRVAGYVLKGVTIRPYAIINAERTSFYLIARYVGNEWAFLNVDDGLVMKADSIVLRLSSPFDPATNVSGRMVLEVVHYAVSAEEIRTMASAQELKGRLYGENTKIDFEKIEDFQKVLSYWSGNVIPILASFRQQTSTKD